jgi:short-subunit dehydrogenase
VSNIVITGASGGIGAEVARQLASKGHSLVLAARREAELSDVARVCLAAGAPSAVGVVTDVTNRRDVDALRDRAVASLGSIDVWMNNAGRGIAKSVLDVTDDDFDEMMTVNVKSALYGMQAIMPYFESRGAGHLINVSSFLGRVPMVPQRSAYNAAKAALNALTANLRMELRLRGSPVVVSLVMPGVVITDFAVNAVGAGPDAGAHYRMHGAQKVEDAAAAIVGLVESPRAELLTNDIQIGMAAKYYTDVDAWEHMWVERTKK